MNKKLRRLLALVLAAAVLSLAASGVMAAEQEDAQAQCALGNLYFTGNGVEQDRARAAELYTRAAEQGDVQALSCLAECYEAGCGVPCDLDRAIALYDQAAALGDGYAHEEASRLRLLRNNRRRKWDFESLQ